MSIFRGSVACAFLCLVLAGCSSESPASPSSETSATSVAQKTIPTVQKVFEWLVGFAEEVGNFIKRTAGSLADALAAAWHAFWGDALVSNVRVKEDDPRRGKYDGILSCHVAWGQKQEGKELPNHVVVTLDHPDMVRESSGSTEWDLAPEVYERIHSAASNLKP